MKNAIKGMLLGVALLTLPGCVVHTYHASPAVVYTAPTYHPPVVYRHVPRTYYVPDYHTYRYRYYHYRY